MTQLERFIKGELVIGPHPNIPNYNRLLKIEGGMWWYPCIQNNPQTGLSYQVYFIDNDENIIETNAVRSYKRVLSAGNDVRVNQQMLVVPKPTNRPNPVYETINPQLPSLLNNTQIINQAEIDAWDASLAAWNLLPTEYEFFIAAANTNTNIFQLMLNVTLLRVSQGKFD